MTNSDFFKEHATLDPRLWNTDSPQLLLLRPEVKRALIRIARDFKNYVGLDFEVEDVVITGSEAGYYYTRHSDLDLHLIVDYKKITCDRELEELFDTKRHLYKRDHRITIRGIPVELYVENITEPAKGPRYSITGSKWITTPQKRSTSTPSINHNEIAKMTKVWSMLIGRSLEAKNPKIAEKTLELLRKYRQMGLKTAGEFGTPNLVYKTLRNSKTLEKLADYVDRAHDRSLSIK